MLIPKDNEMFDTTDPSEFKQNMIEYIIKNWSDVLGDDVKLLKQDNGLDLIAEKYNFTSIKQAG